VNTSPPPIAISISKAADTDAGTQQHDELLPHGAAYPSTAATGSSSSASSSSLADVPQEVMGQIMKLLCARDLASLAATCRGLRAAAWESVPGLRLTLYPHQVRVRVWRWAGLRGAHGGRNMGRGEA
jgi:hypothetical protein